MSLIGRLIEERMLRPSHDMKASQFEQFTPPEGSIVFLGDSITEGGLWHEWFPGLPVVNRGIDGDTTRGVLDRIGVAVAGRPAGVLLLIGTNDLTRRESTADSAGRVGEILHAIRAASPEARILLQSVMPRQAKFRDRVLELNGRYESLARTRRVTYLDLWPALATPEGTLRPDFTLDGLHLNGSGYRAWVDVLRQYVT